MNPPRAHPFLEGFFAPATRSRAARVALVVGPILGLINHFDLLLGQSLTATRVAKICVTFAVPYCVSAYSSASALVEEARRGRTG